MKNIIITTVMFIAVFALILPQTPPTNAEQGGKLPYEILYSINVGEDRYLIHFNVCAGEKSLVSPSIVLESERDTVQFDSTKIIGENSCQDFESIIDTKYPQLVKITIIA